MILLRDNEIDLERWKEFLSENSFASPFQSYEYYKFVNSVPGNSASVFAVEDGGMLQTLVVVTFQKEKGIKGFFSRRAIIYGGPLIRESEFGKSSLSFLLKIINSHIKKRVIYGEIRNFADYEFYRDCYSTSGWKYKAHLNVQISLKDKTIDEILGAMKYNRRREIGLSYKAGASIKEASSTDEIRALYAILKNLYQERVKSPLPSFEFFIRLHQSDNGKVFLVKHNEQVIGGSFCIYYPGLSVNTIYYCGLREYNRNIFPTHLAIMGAIEFGLENKLKMIDLMGAGKPEEEYGVRRYKVEFGGELIENGRYFKIYNQPLYRVGILGLNLINKLKK
jgi:serine/alanine adding enzyme